MGRERAVWALGVAELGENRASWSAVPTSTKASTTITGLVPGTTVTYRHRPITKTGPGDWSQTVTAVVT